MIACLTPLEWRRFAPLVARILGEPDREASDDRRTGMALNGGTQADPFGGSATGSRRVDRSQLATDRLSQLPLA